MLQTHQVLCTQECQCPAYVLPHSAPIHPPTHGPRTVVAEGAQRVGLAVLSAQGEQHQLKAVQWAGVSLSQCGEGHRSANTRSHVYSHGGLSYSCHPFFSTIEEMPIDCGHNLVSNTACDVMSCDTGWSWPQCNCCLSATQEQPMNGEADKSKNAADHAKLLPHASQSQRT